MPRTRSRSGVRQLRQNPVPVATPDAPMEKSTTRRKKRSEERKRPLTKMDMLIRKPKYNYTGVVKRERPATTKMTREDLLVNLDLCASLITPTLERLTPTLKLQVDELMRFKMFKSFNLDMGTLKILQSEECEMDERDQELERLLEMKDSDEKESLIWKHFGLEFQNQERRDLVLLKREDSIDDISLN